MKKKKSISSKSGPPPRDSSRKQAKQKILQQNEVLKGINRVFHEAIASESDEELGRICLNIAESLTSSEIGFIGEKGPDGLLDVIAISDRGRELCTVHEKTEQGRRPGNFKIHGFYGHVLQRGESLLVNEISSHPGSIGVPEGHPPISCFLGVPLVRAGQTIGIVAVGNREGGYRPEDLETLEQLAPAIVEALFHKRAEDALRKSEARLNRSQEIAHLGSWELDLVKNRLTWSNEVYRIFGLQPQEFGATYDAFLERVHPEDRAAVDAAYSGSLRDRKWSYEIEHRIVRKGTGEIRWVHEKCEHIADAAGTIVRSLGMVLDITERRRHEAALRQSEARFRFVVESNMIGVMFADALSGAITDANEEYLRIVGRSRDELKEGLLNWKEITPAEWLAREEKLAEELPPGGRIPPFEKEYFRPDGTRVPVIIGGSFLDEQRRHAVAFVLDNTESKRAEEDLRRKNAFLEAINQGLPILMYAKDSEGRILMANPAQLAHLGKNASQVIGKFTDELLPPHIARELMANDREVLEQGTTGIFEEAGDAITGDRVYLSVKSPYRDGEGRVVGLVGVSFDVTEKKRMEAALREREERFRFLAESIPHFVWSARPDGVSDYHNKRFLEFVGKSGEEMQGYILPAILHPDDLDRSTAAWKEAVNSGREYWIEHRIRRASDGQYRWFLGHALPLRDLSGQIVRWYGTCTDIDDRKRAEVALRRYELLSENTRDVILFMRRDGQILEANVAARKAYGYSRDEILKLKIHDLRAVETRELVADQMAEADARGILFETIHRRKDGSTFPVEVSSRGATTGGTRTLISVIRDITERKLMEEELRKSHDELEKKVQERTSEVKQQAELLDLARDAIVLEKLDGTILLWSDGAAEMYGWSKEETVGKIMRHLLQTHYPVPREKIILKLIQDGQWEGELTHTRKDGKTIKVLSRWTLKRDRLGKPESIMIINHDLTERLQLEEQLRRAQKLESLGTLAGGIAHDFNNLLQPILINTDLALMDIKAGNLPSPESLRLAREGARRGAELVKQIITFSRQKEHPRKPIEITPIIKETIKFLKSVIPKNIELRDRIDLKAAIVLADPTQIHQVLMNLGNNAAHAMRDKGGILEIRLAGRDVNEATAARHGLEPGPYLLLTVKDNGSGMDPKVKEKAFDPFFTTKRPGEGTGMGLSVVHGIVKNYGGDIHLESEVGVGTTVSVFLPLMIQGDWEVENVSPGPIPTGKERILLVDDEEAQVRTIQAILERLGYQVVSTTNAQEALQMFRSRPKAFDLVITDQVMPSLSGNKLAQECLRIRGDIPIILCTGFSETIDEEGARAIGITDFAMKPFTLREIAGKIRRCLDKA